MIHQRFDGLAGLTAAFGLAAALVPLGCGRPGPARQVVQGTVTFAGRPVPAGVIRFEPALALGNLAPMGEAVIRDGVYRTEPGRSPARGAYLARLVGGDGVAAAVSPAAQSDPDAARILAAAAAARPLGREWFRDHVVEVEITGDGRPLDIDVPRPEPVP
jgi:hypothetical protein